MCCCVQDSVLRQSGASDGCQLQRSFALHAFAPAGSFWCQTGASYIVSLCVRLHLQVVLLWNLSVASGLANGTRGVVEGFASIQDYLIQVRPHLHNAAAMAHKPARHAGTSQALLLLV